MPGGIGLWLRWSVRDLSSRWVVVAATALIIAMGTGGYASLSAQKDWRRDSLEASFAASRGHDLRLALTEDSYVRSGRLARAARDVDGVAEAEERLVAASQVDASRPGRPLLVPARVVGVPMSAGGAAIDRLAVDAGRGLRPGDRGDAVAVLEQQFADFHELPATGSIRVGGTAVRYVGTGTTPDHFLLTSGVGWGAEASLAVVFMPLGTAQGILGLRGRVNELVVRAAPGSDLAALARRVRAAVRAELPGVGLTVTEGTEEDAYRTLYRDAGNDGRVFTIYAYLILMAATFSAFILITRVVEAQRREIGIGMALGVPPRVLALRPLLMAGQIALLGVGLGMAVGVLFGRMLAALIEDAIPLPVYAELFRLDRFVVAGLLGFTLPFAAALWPVWRGVRQQPVDAIRVGARAATAAGLTPLLRRVPLPGGSLAQMPIRNVMRTPRRTLLIVLGIAAGLAALVSLAGMIDSLRHTIDLSERTMLQSNPNRLSVNLQGLLRRDGDELTALRRVPELGRIEPGLLVQATLRGDEDVEVALQTIASRDPIWRPPLTAGALGPRAPGIVISERAAEQTGVSVGDLVRLRHPVLRDGTVDLVETPVPVAGVHPNPFRFLAYVDERHLEPFRLGGITNLLTVTPSPGASTSGVERALFGMPGVASVEPASTLTEVADRAVDEFLAAIVMTEAIVFGLALLIAFNATSISTDERRRETATMLAFGVPLRTTVLLMVAENIVIGLLATLIGLAGGMLLVGWMIDSTLPDTFPELAVEPHLGAGSIALTVAVGFGAVTLAPLMTARRLRRMDIPATLRVVE